jgi:hypothetical protein
MPIRKTGGCQIITPPIPFGQMNHKGNHGPIAKQAGEPGLDQLKWLSWKEKSVIPGLCYAGFARSEI